MKDILRDSGTINPATNMQTVEAYNDGADKYIAEMRNDIDPSLREWIGRALDGLDSSARILEIGSASGRDADYVESLGYNVERTDASQGFVDRLRAGGKDARLLNILTDEVDDEQYDLVYANAVFLHFTTDEFNDAVRKVYKALRPGGHFALSLKRGDGEETTARKLDMPRYFHYWQSDDVESALASAGFENFQDTVSDDWRENKPQWLFVTVEKGSEV